MKFLKLYEDVDDFDWSFDYDEEERNHQEVIDKFFEEYNNKNSIIRKLTYIYDFTDGFRGKERIEILTILLNKFDNGDSNMSELKTLLIITRPLQNNTMILNSRIPILDRLNVMKNVRRNENFDFDEDDFDEDETPENDVLNDLHAGKWIKIYRKDWERFTTEHSTLKWLNNHYITKKDYHDILVEEKDQYEGYGEHMVLDELSNFINIDYVYIRKDDGDWSEKYGKGVFMTYDFDNSDPINSDKEFRLYENFDWNDEDFDEDEFSEIIPKIGDTIRFEKSIMWDHVKGKWQILRNTLEKVEIRDIKLVSDIDYLQSNINNKKIPLGENYLPTDYDGYMVLTRYWPWFKLEDWENINEE